MSKSIYDMSDEELLALTPQEIAAAEAESGGAPAEEEPDTDDDAPESAAVSAEETPDTAQATDDDEGDGADDGASAAGQGSGEEAGDEVGGEEKPTETPAPAAAVDADDDDDAASPNAEAPPAETVAIDYEAEYKRVLGPFKANGKEMQVDSIDDAITLMQMGANYNKKMAALKPNLRLLKMLENNGVLDEEKLSFLIDLEKRKPEAIRKLVKDSGLDPLEIDQGQEGEYKPSTYTVQDKEIELDEVLEKLQDTPTFRKMIDVVSNKWDGPSKQIIADQPELLEIINGHMARGVYDLISTEVEKQRMLGRLNGLSDLAAYQRIGKAMDERGAFDHLSQGSASGQRREVQPKPATPDPVRNDKRRAASPTRTEVPAGKKPAEEFNPLAMSDEEFAKQVQTRLL